MMKAADFKNNFHCGNCRKLLQKKKRSSENIKEKRQLLSLTRQQYTEWKYSEDSETQMKFSSEI